MYIYCINTTSNYILINEIKFSDFSESNSPKINKKINKLVLDKLNNIQNSVNIENPNYLEQGIDEDILVHVKDSIYKIVI